MKRIAKQYPIRKLSDGTGKIVGKKGRGTSPRQGKKSARIRGRRGKKKKKKKKKDTKIKAKNRGKNEFDNGSAKLNPEQGGLDVVE